MDYKDFEIIISGMVKTINAEERLNKFLDIWNFSEHERTLNFQNIPAMKALDNLLLAHYKEEAIDHIHNFLYSNRILYREAISEILYDKIKDMTI
ncbi:MAG: hypothetical protein [Caudoviricetes sp.]|nr:MAG: hypothetical protein [Caudoviricetes sp.]